MNIITSARSVLANGGASALAGGLSSINALTSLVGKKSGAMLKGMVMNLDTGIPYAFQYNPTTISYGRNADYIEISSPGSSVPIVEYVKGQGRDFSVELFLYDHSYSGTIDLARAYFEDFLPPEDNKASYFKPPIMLFYYGTFIKKCVLVGLDITIERHDKHGLPLQARFTLRLKQVGK